MSLRQSNEVEREHRLRWHRALPNGRALVTVDGGHERRRPLGFDLSASSRVCRQPLPHSRAYARGRSPRAVRKGLRIDLAVLQLEADPPPTARPIAMRTNTTVVRGERVVLGGNPSTLNGEATFLPFRRS